METGAVIVQYLPSFTTTETLQHLCVFYLFWSLGVLQFGLKRWSVSAVHIFTKQHLLPQKSLAISGDLNVHPIAFNAPILSSAKNQKTQEPKNKKKNKTKQILYTNESPEVQNIHTSESTTTSKATCTQIGI